METKLKLLSLKEIDAVEDPKEKLRLWITYAKAFNCFPEMPEINELYTRLKKEEQVTIEDWNQWINSEEGAKTNSI